MGHSACYGIIILNRRNDLRFIYKTVLHITRLADPDPYFEKVAFNTDCIVDCLATLPAGAEYLVFGHPPLRPPGCRYSRYSQRTRDHWKQIYCLFKKFFPFSYTESLYQIVSTSWSNSNYFSVTIK